MNSDLEFSIATGGSLVEFAFSDNNGGRGIGIPSWPVYLDNVFDMTAYTEVTPATTPAAEQPPNSPQGPSVSPSPVKDRAVEEVVEDLPTSPVEDHLANDGSRYSPAAKYAAPASEPAAVKPIYPAFSGRFASSEEARAHRRHVRVGPKTGARDVERVKLYGRDYWVRRIYESMIDISTISDGEKSVHRSRFVSKLTFEPEDLEATAHHIFDSALAVHERGWNRLHIYHKKVVRGKLEDQSRYSIESRLTRICMALRQRKATVDDAMRGGVTLALLCDNPDARAATKSSNNDGNSKRGKRLQAAKKVEENLKQKLATKRRFLDAALKDQAGLELKPDAKGGAKRALAKRVVERRAMVAVAQKELEDMQVVVEKVEDEDEDEDEENLIEDTDDEVNEAEVDP